MAATQIGSDAVVIYGAAADMVSPAGFPVGSLFVVDSGVGIGLEYSVGNDGEWFIRGQIKPDASGAPALNTILGGVITAVDGPEALHIVNAPDGVSTGTDNFIEGLFESFDIAPISAIPAAGGGILVGWSTDAGASLEISNRLAAVSASITNGITPPGDTPVIAHPGVAIITLAKPVLAPIYFDGTTTIKTIGLRVTAGAVESVVGIHTVS